VPGTTVTNVRVKFTFPAAETYTIAVRLSPDWQMTNVQVVETNANAVCGVSIPPSGPLEVTVTQQPFQTDRYCVYGFSIAIPGTAIPGKTAEIQSFAGDTSPGATPIGTSLVQVQSALVSAEFGAIRYFPHPGGLTTGTLILNFSGPVAPGQVTIAHPSLADMTLRDGSTQSAGTGVTCDTFSTQLNGNLVFNSSSSNAGSCTVSFNINVSETTPEGFVSNALQASRATQAFVTNPTVDLDIRRLPRITFTPDAVYGIPGTTISSQFVIRSSANEPQWTFSLTAPAGWTLGNFQNTASQGSTCSAITGAGPTYTGTQSNIVTIPNNCTYSFDITIPVDAVPGDMAITAGVTGSTATVGNLPITVYTPVAPSAAFDRATYSAYTGDSTGASLDISISTPFAGGLLSIVNPDPDALTFSNACLDSVPSSGSPQCDPSFIDSNGNVLVDVPAATPGSMVVTFTIAVADNAPAGLAGNLVATLGGGDPIDPASFTIHAQLVAQPLPFTLLARQTVSGDLNTTVSGGTPPYTFTVGDQPLQGVLNLKEDGTFTYLASDDAHGTDSFTFNVTDDQGTTLTSAATATGIVTLVFTPAATATATATQTSPTPTATSISGDGTGGGNNGGSSGGGVTQLPSTGTASASPGTSATTLVLLLAFALILLGAATARGQRLTRRVHQDGYDRIAGE